MPAPARVHCLMREGAFLTELINNAGDHLDGEVEAVPLWLNRRLCLRASVTRLDRETLDGLLGHRSEPTVRELLDVLGLDASELPSFSTQMDTSLRDPLIREGIVKRLAADSRLEARVLSEARALRERIVALMSAQAREGEPLVIVDVGWGATIQRYLEETLAAAGVPPTRSACIWRPPTARPRRPCTAPRSTGSSATTGSHRPQRTWCSAPRS